MVEIFRILVFVNVIFGIILVWLFFGKFVGEVCDNCRFNYKEVSYVMWLG